MRQQLEEQVTLTPHNRLLVNANGDWIPLPFTYAFGLEVIQEYPDYYAAGLVGPDAFPDMITGQMMMHGDYSAQIRALHEALNEDAKYSDAKNDRGLPIQDRPRPSQLRAIDFAMLLIEDVFGNAKASTSGNIPWCSADSASASYSEDDMAPVGDFTPDSEDSQIYVMKGDAPENMNIGSQMSLYTDGTLVDIDLDVDLDWQDAADRHNALSEPIPTYSNLGAVSYDGGSNQRMKIAFALGYLGHGIGDSFAHDYVNRLAGGAFAITEGEGAFGPLTQELKHIAIEGVVDWKLPAHLKYDNGRLPEGYRLRAPLKALDDFYRDRFKDGVRGNPNPPPGRTNGEVGEYLKHYKDVDTRLGGPVYTYFDANRNAGEMLSRVPDVRKIVNKLDDASEDGVIHGFLLFAKIVGWITAAPDAIASTLLPDFLANPAGWAIE